MGFNSGFKGLNMKKKIVTPASEHIQSTALHEIKQVVRIIIIIIIIIFMQVFTIT